MAALPRNPALALRRLVSQVFPGHPVDEQTFRKMQAYCDAREPTERELQLLRRLGKIGGHSTHFGSKLHDQFEAMADQGWVKETTLVDNGVAWKLSGEGHIYAFD